MNYSEYFYIDVFPARHGDCFVVRSGDGKTKTNILIDGGLWETYDFYLRDYLKAMHSSGESIDLLVVTHIDQDHIEGIIELLKENGQASNPNIIEIKEVWFNSLRHLQVDEKKNVTLETESIQNKRIEHLRNEVYKPSPKKGISQVSQEEGTRLAAILLAGNYNWNTTFNGAVCIENAKALQGKFSGLELHLLSPDYNKKLKRLKKSWITFLQERKILPLNYQDGDFIDDAFEYAISLEAKAIYSGISQVNSSQDDLETIYKENEQLDLSRSNGSSIAFILTFKNKNFLFLADGHSKIIENQIKELSKTNPHLSEFVLVKVSHHGSKNNTTKSFLNSISCKNFLITTNGDLFKHPDLHTIIKIGKMKNDSKNIFLNYHCKKLDKDIIQSLEADYKTNIRTFNKEAVFRLSFTDQNEVLYNELT
ncbi:MAG: MBL fold metallo-hydrolase [Leptospiraceae bacterium]|nr:MBL fold metallo-hydrolase [Leptospiraceae bacterium]